jgi:hypothetical protein
VEGEELRILPPLLAIATQVSWRQGVDTSPK